jgi:hypothetical protein
MANSFRDLEAGKARMVPRRHQRVTAIQAVAVSANEHLPAGWQVAVRVTAPVRDEEPSTPFAVAGHVSSV